ncbi:hypothetical protein [Actinacidiphila glaucinigra]|uniref:hypothetical protein n=1 Tax=Actinacidiphila glaucinigra TaxID=235986 RepID=UPI0035E253BD
MQHTARTAPPEADLQYIADYWDRLDDLLDSSPGTTWPPPRKQQVDIEADEAEPHRHAQHLSTRQLLNGRITYECLHCEYVGDGGNHIARPDRDPAQLGARPVPIRLSIIDTSITIREALIACAEYTAELVQRQPILPPAPRRAAVARTRAERLAWKDHARRIDAAMRDRNDPRRWRFQAGGHPTAPDAALWLLARLVGDPGPFTALTPAHRGHIATVARENARLLRVAIRDERTHRVLDGMACPGCKGELVFHQGGGEPDIVSCSAGLTDCSARAPWHPDTRRREWDGDDLVELWQQLDAAMTELRARQARQAEDERRARRTEARRRQRAAAKERAAA